MTAAVATFSARFARSARTTERRAFTLIEILATMTLLAIVSQRLLPREDGKGRVLAYELLKNSTAISNLIREGKTHQVYSVIETNTKEGMVTMDRSIKRLYMEGAITYDDAVAHVRNPKILK